MSDLYQLMNVVGVKEDNRQILKTLQEISRGELSNDLRLLNYFHEVPVSYPGTVDNVEDDMVDISVHQNQAVVMHLQKMTFLKSRHFPHDVVAKVFRSDINKSLAILTSFAYAQVRAERRQFVRVKLDGKMPVSFASPTLRFNGTVDDISIGGMSVCAEPMSGVETQIQGTLSLVLDSARTDIPATLLKVMSEDGVTKYIFELDADTKIENRISQYIFQRQLQIIREIKDSL